jgi:FkbM family methyltransferase
MIGWLRKIKQQYNEAAFRKQKVADEKRTLPLKINFYKQFIQPGNLVFDVGANVGNRIDAFLALEAKVVAVEPQPACITILEQKFAESIHIEKLGLGSQPGQLEMQIANDSTISTFSNQFIEATKKGRFSSYNWNQTITVPITTLEHLIQQYGIPQFCKIDVEGFELPVLEGLQSAIPFLSFEYCVPEMLEQALACTERLHQIAPAGMFNYSVAETMQLAEHHWMNYQQFKTLLASPQFSESLFGDIYFSSNPL